LSAGTLIVGASQAGLQLAVSLRALGDEQPITLVGAEVHPPYQRPPLSKAFLSGTLDVGSLAFRTAEFYAQAGIDLVCGERVTGIDLPQDRRQVPGVATTAGGRRLPFDRLALAVGGRPRRLHVPGSDLDGVTYLRDLDDATLLRTRLASAERVVVVGGGFIGLEATAAARSAGKVVTVVEAADRLLPRAVAPVVSEFYRQAHGRRGTTVLLSAQVCAFRGDHGHVRTVHLSDGTVLDADLVLVGVGLVPRTELAEQLGLECDGGIVVNSHACTSEPSIVAAGDCTVLPHPVTGVGRVRLESVQNAVAQARVAASSLVGRDVDGGPADTRTVPWFWSDQHDLKLQIAGLNTGYDRCVVRGDPDSERFSVLYYRDGRLLSIDSVNRPVDYMAVRKALADGATISADEATDIDRPLKSLIVRPGDGG
jgi:3-phenylpropionate/trans-cinnamate dioxygenase ferredoxin reductase subunit